jgi:hypothetical protein
LQIVGDLLSIGPEGRDNVKVGDQEQDRRSGADSEVSFFLR